jgi:predicted RNA binding protein YcfA (HicA-like mRNA interferase family)
LKLPRISGKEAVEALLRSGFAVHRVHGSHYILKHPDRGYRVTVPYHRQELAPKTLHSILKQAGIPAEKFIELL